MRTLEEAIKAFKSIPMNQDQKGAVTIIEAQTLQLVEHVFNEVPVTADRTAGLRKLLEAKQAFIQAISHDWDHVHTDVAPPTAKGAA